MTKKTTTTQTAGAKQTYAEQIAAEIVASLESGLPAWRKSWKAVINMAPANGHSKRAYHSINAWRLAGLMQNKGWADPRFYTFKQVQQLGGKVKKGEHGTLVEFWLWRSGQIVVGATDDGDLITEKVKPFSVIRSIVFNAAQCEGLPELDAVKPVQEWNPIERAEIIMKASGVEIRHNQGDRAFYTPVGNYIDLPPRGAFKTAADYYATALHELVHATGHRTRVGRDLSHSFGTPGYALEELRAEIGCLMLCAKIGINPPEQDAQHKAYIKSWLAALKNDPKEIFRAANDAEKALNWILERESEYTPTTAAAPTPVQPAPVVVAEPIAAKEVPTPAASEQMSLF